MRPAKIPGQTMKRMINLNDYSSTLGLEEVKSEYLRSILLVGVFSTIIIVVIANYILFERTLVEYYGGIQTFVTLIGFLFLFITYQLISIRFLRKRIQNSQTIDVRFKIIQTTLEMSFPSAIMFFMMNELKMLSFIDSPIVLTYFLLLILSVLHLDYRINIFAGLLAGIQYAFVINYGFNHIDPLPAYKPVLPENSYYVRSVILALSGGTAAFVSSELKKRIKSAFDFREAKNKVELLFGQQVSKEISKALIEEAGLTKKQEATVMFLDIRNFTAFADSHSADEVIEYQNKFVSPVIDIINLHQGVVFQILGDGLMACFGAPVENALHADMAFHASIDILRQVEKLSAQKIIPPTKIGIGLHSGLVVTGNIGNEQRKQFSISGAPVIVASRIEQLNKKYNSEFLLSGEVHKQIIPGKIMISHLGLEPIRGIEKAVEIYKVVLGTQKF